MAIIRSKPFVLAQGVDLSVPWTSDIMDFVGCMVFGVTYFMPAATRAGTLAIKSGQVPDVSLMQGTRFFGNTLANVTTGIVTVTTGVVANGGMTFNFPTERYFVLVWTPTSGAGLISAFACGKN